MFEIEWRHTFGIFPWLIVNVIVYSKGSSVSKIEFQPQFWGFSGVVHSHDMQRMLARWWQMDFFGSIVFQIRICGKPRENLIVKHVLATKGLKSVLPTVPLVVGESGTLVVCITRIFARVP